MRTFTLSEIRARNLKLIDNILLKLSSNFLLKWLANDRLGLFGIDSGSLYFLFGNHRTDIYQPIPGKFYPFELASLLHDLKKSNHFSLIDQLMKHRSEYIFLRDDSRKYKNSLYYQNENEILDVNTRIRVSRKRNRRSK